MLVILRDAVLLGALAFLANGACLAAEEGSICVVVRDTSGAAIPDPRIVLQNRGSELGPQQSANGESCFAELEAGEYAVTAAAAEFERGRRTVLLRAFESLRVEMVLKVSPVHDQITVRSSEQETGQAVRAETSVGSSLIRSLPGESVNAALSSVLTLAVPGVAADSNGVFHPLGEHAETSLVLDGQPISDQQSRIFSNQISLRTVEELVAIHGAPPAEFGDKTSLIVVATTRSGLGTGKLNGQLAAGGGSFGTATASFGLAAGNHAIGNFLSGEAFTSSRYLDTPELQPLHAGGNTESVLDRLDLKTSDRTSVRLNVSAARSWFQTPNTYLQQGAGQDQRQHMKSFNFGAGFSTAPSPFVAVSGNLWFRQDRVSYQPSLNLLADRPATLSQSRKLGNTGGKADVTFAKGKQLLKAGIQVQVTPLSEFFQTGLTDSAFNSPCLTDAGQPVGDSSLKSVSQCVSSGFESNPGFQAGLLPYDLSRGGVLFQFRGTATVSEQSAFVQDTVKAGRWTFTPGLRFDRYDGLSHAYGVQPRAGVAYQVPSSGTLLRVSYARVFLTPYNENLVLSSATGPGGLANGSLGASRVDPLRPARRNQFNMGLQHSFGKKLTVDAEYFWKFTEGAYDFNVILNTPLNFPIQFRKSKIDGATARVNFGPVRGLSLFTVIGHTRSPLFSPEVGGINFGQQYAPVARPDHDQGFQQTTYARYEFKRYGGWIAAVWRFDSGLVVVSVPDYATALGLSGDDQQQMGLYCGSTFATVSEPLRSCHSPFFGATRIHIAAAGTFDPDRNPSRIAPRNLLDLGFGADSLWKKDAVSLGVQATIVNLADRSALYNYLSSFSGTHFVSPRALQAGLILHF